MKGPCSFGGCRAKAHKQGYCHAHARLIDAGLPLRPLKNFQSRLPWLEERVGYTGDECLIWPHSRNKAGYGQVRFEGKQANSHRVMCILAHGEPPTPDHQAAHSCGKGHLGCVNPKHLSWKTPAANNADKIIHGTIPRGERHWNSRLSDGQVVAIRELALTVKSRRALGELFGISLNATYGILRHNARAA